MNGITHKQAIQWIHRRLDGLLSESQHSSLDEHLHSCDSCRAYETELDGLSAHMQNEFHRRWDEKSGPSQNVMEHVIAKARRTPLANRIFSGAKLFAGAMALIFLAVAINFVVSRLQNMSPATNSTKTVNNRLLAFTSDQNGNYDIYTVHPDGSELTNLTNHPADDMNPIWSPNGEQIAFERRDSDGFSQIYSMNADGSNVIQLTEGNADHYLAWKHGESSSSPWSPDGGQLLFFQNGETGHSLHVMDANGENKKSLVDEPNSYIDPSWSPDGQHIAFIKGGIPYDLGSRLYVVKADGSNLANVIESLPEDESLWAYMLPRGYYWSPDGQSIYFVSASEVKKQSKVYQASLDGSKLTEKPVSNQSLADWWEIVSSMTSSGTGEISSWIASARSEFLARCGADDESRFALNHRRSPNGNLVFASRCPNGDWWLYWTNPDGTVIKQLHNSPLPSNDFMYDDSIVWSSDDQYITFSYGIDANSRVMYIVNVEKALVDPATQPVQVPVKIGEFFTVPSWQPIAEENLVKDVPTPQPKSALNGLLAFTSNQNGNFDIYTMYPNGSGLTNLTDNPAVDIDPFWSPDGKRIAFTSGRDGSSQIYLMDADGSDVIQLISGEASHKFARSIHPFSPWSPDGSKLLFLESPPGEEQWKLYVMDANGENKTPLVDEPNTYGAISWSPDGQHIALIADDPQNLGGDRIYVVNADGGNLRELTKSLQQSEQLSAYDYHWSPDSQSIFFVAFFQKPDPYWTAYEARLDDLALIAHATTNDIMYGWWNDIYLVNNFTASAPFEWVHPDGTTTTLNSQEKCQSIDPNMSGDFVTQSPNGNWVITGHCSNSDTWFYWANFDGTIIKPIVDSPIPLVADQMSTISWSPDDQFITFTISSTDLSDMYILNVSEALNGYFHTPVKISDSFGPSWQPASGNDIVEENLAPEPTQETASESVLPIDTGKPNGEWIAFIGGDAVPDPIPVNQDVYMIHPDGSGLVNLTQSPAHYYNLQWSPDGQHLSFIRNTTDNKTDIMSHHVGDTSPRVLASTVFNPAEYNPNQYFEYSWSPDSKQIAFLDKRAGNYDIYAIDADVSNEPELRQLTNDTGQEIDFAWSPDGSQIAYQRTTGEQLSIMVMNADGSNQHEVARGMGRVSLHWSADGKSIYVNSVYRGPTESQHSHLECEGCVVKPAIYRIDPDDQSVQQIYYEEDPSKVDGWYLHDTPQNTLYFMRGKPQSFLGIWGTWFRADGNSVEEIGEMNPHQTCKTTTGNILNEHISPNNRFSIISNFCAGGFDLYLADREAPNPKRKFVHLLQLPLSTWGQGGDNATLPMLWSPDGRWLVYDDGNQSIYLLDIEQILRDPTAEPVILFQSDSNLFMLSELAWQPKP